MVYKIKAPAKINISLDVTGKRNDGYHLLSTIMQTIDLSDIITISIKKPENIKLSDKKIILRTNKPYIPCDEKNTAYKAAKTFLENSSNYFKDYVFDIKIDKNIPVQAGLGGGSSDAAGVLAGLNHIAENMFSQKELIEMGAAIGADVPFCIKGGTVLCEGIGEIMTELPDLPELNLLIVKPDFGVSTPWIFRHYSPDLVKKRPVTANIIKSIENQDLSNLFLNTANVLEDITVTGHPEIPEIKSRLLDCKACFSMMSGSGSAVFGVFQNEKEALSAKSELNDILKNLKPVIIKTRTCRSGPTVVET